MRTLATLLAALFALSLVPDFAQAGERRSGFRMTFGFLQPSSVRRARVARARAARARAARRSRSRNARRAARRARAKAVSRRALRRRAKASRKARRRVRTRNVRRRAARRKPARRSTRRTARRPAKRVKAWSNRFARTTVPYRTKQKPGTIIVETGTRHLYYVLPGGRAVRYGVAVGREGFGWTGTSRVRRKVKWPSWTPPAEMIERDPKLAEFRGGMPGGPANPLGARALYLYKGKQDTLYRIHGTNKPASIGRAASSGCIRMRNEDVAHLYAKVRMGTKVIVR